MKHVVSLICVLVFFCNAVMAQSNGKSVAGKDTVSCKCIGSSFDSCCDVKKVCCETKLVDISATANNKLIKSYKNYTIQKNFVDAEPFYFDDFSLLYGKSNLCIRICNINRLAFDVSAKGVVQSVALKDTGIFDGLAKVFKGITTVNTPPKTDVGSATTKSEDGKENNPPKKPTALDNLKANIAVQQFLIKPLLKKLREDINKLNYFANFAKNAKTIVGSERGIQARLKYNLGNEVNIKTFGAAITFDSLPNLINNTVPAYFEDMKETLEEINTIKDKIKKYKDDYKNKNAVSDEDLIFADLPKDEEKIIKIATDADKAELVKTQEALIDLWIKVNDESNFFFVQCFGRGDGESINIDFKAIPNSINKNRFDTVPYIYSVPVKGKFKWAIGPSLNFHFGKSLINETYSLDSSRGLVPGNSTNLKDTFNISKNPQRAKLIPYVGFMAHFYWQSNKMITPAISVGLSTSPTQLSDLRAYLGASAIIGGPIKGKLIFSAGLAGAAVDRLKPNLAEGFNQKNRILFNGNNLPSPDQLVDKVFAIGGFFGMTYNLKD